MCLRCGHAPGRSYAQDHQFPCEERTNPPWPVPVMNPGPHYHTISHVGGSQMSLLCIHPAWSPDITCRLTFPMCLTTFPHGKRLPLVATHSHPWLLVGLMASMEVLYMKATPTLLQAASSLSRTSRAELLTGKHFAVASSSAKGMARSLSNLLTSRSSAGACSCA